MRRLLVITNADAGTADEEAIDAALAVLRAGADVDVVATSSPEDLDEVVADPDGRWLVVAGGDGSVHAVLAALHRADRLAAEPLGLIPLGTGNDLARTLGLPLDAAEAAEVVLTGTPRGVDLVVDDDGEVTANSVHAGAGADAGAKGARWKERLGSIGVGQVNLGRLGYPIGAMQTAMRPPVLHVRIEVDGAVVADRDDPVLMVAVGNGASVGGGTELTPGASPHDGLLDVLIATPAGPFARLGYALRLPFARHGERGDVHITVGREVRVTGAPFECNSDGEISGPVSDRTWRVLPAAYEMVLPGPAQSDESSAGGAGN